MIKLEELAAGQDLPELRKSVGLTQMVAYAGATWDFHRYHYDTEYTKSVGMAGPIADGQMFGAYLAQMLLDWAGSDALIKKMAMKYKSLVIAGEEVVCWGRVSEIDHDSRTATVEMGVRGADGRDVVAPASAVLEL